MRKVVVMLIGAVLGACGDKGGGNMMMGTVIGSTTVEIDTRLVTVWVGEAAIGDWISDQLLAEVKKTPGNDMVQVALVNAGAIRGGGVDPMTFMFLTNEGKIGRVYPPGPLTDLDVAGWFPFNNDHDIITLTGTQLKSALERGVSSLPPDLRNEKGGYFLQTAGITYTIDCAGTTQKLSADSKSVMEEGTRITRITVGSTVIYDRVGSVDMLAATNVRVVLNNFISAGLDGHVAFPMGTDRATLKRESFDIVKKMQATVMAGPIAPMKDGRITIIGDCGQPLTRP